MVYAVCLWAILVGAWGDQRWLATRIPKLPEWLAPLRDKLGEIGLTSVILAVLILLRSFIGFLGLLGLPFDGLVMLFWLWYLALAPVLLLFGVIHGTGLVRARINDSRKEAALVRISDGLRSYEPKLGRAAWVMGLGLLILAFIA